MPRYLNANTAPFVRVLEHCHCSDDAAESVSASDVVARKVAAESFPQLHHLLLEPHKGGGMQSHDVIGRIDRCQFFSDPVALSLGDLDAVADLLGLHEPLGNGVHDPLDLSLLDRDLTLKRRPTVDRVGCETFSLSQILLDVSGHCLGIMKITEEAVDDDILDDIEVEALRIGTATALGMGGAANAHAARTVPAEYTHSRAARTAAQQARQQPLWLLLPAG